MFIYKVKFLIIHLFNYLLLQGEYRTVFERLYSCPSTNLIQWNAYLSKRTSNVTDVIGNITLLTPFNDSLIVSKYLIINLTIIVNTYSIWSLI